MAVLRQSTSRRIHLASAGCPTLPAPSHVKAQGSVAVPESDNTQGVCDIANEACIYFYSRKVIPAGTETMNRVRSFRDKHPAI
jgi:hypothetical protein